MNITVKFEGKTVTVNVVVTELSTHRSLVIAAINAAAAKTNLLSHGRYTLEHGYDYSASLLSNRCVVRNIKFAVSQRKIKAMAKKLDKARDAK